MTNTFEKERSLKNHQPIKINDYSIITLKFNGKQAIIGKKFNSRKALKTRYSISTVYPEVPLTLKRR